MPTIRAATMADLGAVDLLLRRSYGRLLAADYPPSTLVLALPAMARAQPRLLASGRYLVAELEGEVVAAGGWSTEPPGRGALVPGLGHVRHVATDARHARKGLGRLLMAEVMARAGGEGVRRLSALSTLTAVPFYAALGFRKERRVVLTFGGATFPAVEMTRDL